MNNRKLIPGDRIYRLYRGVIERVIAIDRVTKTQAISKESTWRFKIDTWNNGKDAILIDEEFNMYSYELETPELIHQWLWLTLIEKIKSLKWDKIPVDKLKQALTILTDEE